jgi:DNA end-binding protein Ku
MAPRAVWKGFLKIAELTCPVSLYTAVSTSERIAFHTLNAATGHRVHRQFVDSETGEPVPREDQVKGYQVGQGEYVVLEPEELAAAVPENDKSLAVQSFVPCGEIDQVYLDRPYYMLPSDAVATKAYGLIREGLARSKVAALARAVMFRRVRTVLVRAEGDRLVANLLNFDYEVRSSAEVFETVPDLTIKAEMLELAQHIIKTKLGAFDPKAFDDRYENAVAEMVRAKIEGRPLKPKAAPKASNVVDLMAALRESAKVADGASGPKPASKRRSANASAAQSAPKKPAAQRRKAG